MSTEISTSGIPIASLSNIALKKLMEEIENILYDRKSIPQESLDLANKFRTSLFPWRGQFSPELIELFLKKYSQDASVILDPFVGSGTTLFEAARRGLTCYAAEINPSAVEMARTVHFVNLPLAERKHSIQRAVMLAEECIHPFTWDLFSYQNYDQPPQQNFADAIEASFGKMLKQAEEQPFVQNLLTNAIIRFMSYETTHSETDFLRALQEHAAIVKNLPYSRRECRVLHVDARSIPLPGGSVDLIITSPPYINVFNYHQNNRSAMELIGWDLLDIAKSEIGSNRKNRQNRFLTVVQYALDMLDVLKEMRRLLRADGRAIIVMGRESNVRGLRFKNGLLVAALASGGSGFRLETRQERKFKNKFGEIIYEDILHLLPDSLKQIADDSFARSLAEWSLLEASINAEEEVRNEALNAREHSSSVLKSPLFRPPVDHYQPVKVVREENAPYEVKDATMIPYLEFLSNHPYRAKVFERFLGYIRQLLKNDPLDEQTVLERGYF